MMLEGPVTIGHGLNVPPVCAFSVFFYFFDTVLYETLFSSDVGLVLLCLGFFPPISLTSL